MSQEAKPLTYHVDRQPRAPKPRKRHAPVFVELTAECEVELNRLEAALFRRIRELASQELLDLIYAHSSIGAIFDHDTARTLTLGEWKDVTKRARELIGEA